MSALFWASVKKTNKRLGIFPEVIRKKRNRKLQELLWHEKMLFLGTLQVNNFFLLAKFMFWDQTSIIVNVPGTEEIQLIRKQKCLLMESHTFLADVWMFTRIRRASPRGQKGAGIRIQPEEPPAFQAWGKRVISLYIPLLRWPKCILSHHPAISCT